MEELETPLEGASPDSETRPEKPAAAEESHATPGGQADSHATPGASDAAGASGANDQAEEAAGGADETAAVESHGANDQAEEVAGGAEEISAGESHGASDQAEAAAGETAEVSVDELLASSEPTPVVEALEDAQLRAVLEAIVYVAEEPLTLAQLSTALQQPAERVSGIMGQLMVEFDKPEHGVAIREVAGGYKMATKAEHHEAVRSFVKSLKPPLKLSLPALETLAVIAYKQPVTAPEIMEIRGVQGAGVLKTLLDRKVIAVAGRKNVIGKPILYKTTKEFLIQFGLKDLSELPSLKEFEEIRRMAFSDDAAEPLAETASEPAADAAPAAEAAPPTEPEAAAPEAAPEPDPASGESEA
jgi:segregation and condensation protein B